MRKRAKIDDNQTVIVKALRAIGASVQSLATIGGGCPDLVVGYRGVNYLLEIKDGSKPPSKRKLTPDEREFIDNWRGKVSVVNSINDAIKAVAVKT